MSKPNISYFVHTLSISFSNVFSGEMLLRYTKIALPAFNVWMLGDPTTGSQKKITHCARKNVTDIFKRISSIAILLECDKTGDDPVHWHSMASQGHDSYACERSHRNNCQNIICKWNVMIYITSFNKANEYIPYDIINPICVNNFSGNDFELVLFVWM